MLCYYIESQKKITWQQRKRAIEIVDIQSLQQKTRALSQMKVLLNSQEQVFYQYSKGKREKTLHQHYQQIPLVGVVPASPDTRFKWLCISNNRKEFESTWLLNKILCKQKQHECLMTSCLMTSSQLNCNNMHISKDIRWF